MCSLTIYVSLRPGNDFSTIGDSIIKPDKNKIKLIFVDGIYDVALVFEQLKPETTRNATCRFKNKHHRFNVAIIMKLTFHYYYNILKAIQHY